MRDMTAHERDRGTGGAVRTGTARHSRRGHRGQRARYLSWGLTAAKVVAAAGLAVLCGAVLSGPNGADITVSGNTAVVVLAALPIVYLIGSMRIWKHR